jgi:eukaryotic-like serine/threonine-protein kinase
MASNPSKIADQIRFGEDFELDLRSYELRRAGRVLKLERIPMELLLLLIEAKGQLVTRDQIIEKIWGKDVFLDTDSSINAAIRKIRQVLKDDPDEPRFVQTVTGRGYRFIAPVVQSNPPEVVPAVAEEQPSAQPKNLAGKKVSHYRILQVVGGGGMGIVYKAEDLKLGRPVAIKFLPAEMATDPQAFDRLEREARAASALEHPNICPIYELGEHEGQPFIVMQLLEGQTLQEKIDSASLQKRPLPTNEVLDLALQITAGLEAAHQKGIVHRDIKPANIFVTQRREAKILDFGLAKIMEQDSVTNQTSERDALSESSAASTPTAAFSNLRLTRTGTTVGTAHYMSPEQVRGEALDARTDLFSFGLVLYEMVTGQRAFSGKTAAVIHNAILHSTPVPIQQLNPGSSAALQPIITRAIEKDCDLRYQSATDMRSDLKRLKRDVDSGQSSVTGSGQVTVIEATAPKIGRSSKVAVLVLSVGVLLAAGLYYRSRQAPSLTEKDTIVLADFANSTGDAVFDDALKTALSVSLRQSPFLNMLSDSEVAKTLQLMTIPPDTKLTPAVARELCQRAASKAYIAGSIGSLGSEYVLGLKAVSCQSGDLLAQEQATAASKEKVLQALGKAASKLRGELGESLATVEKFDVLLQQATTSSLEALKAFSLGEKTNNEKGDAAALPYFQHAIELDPNFALAYTAAGANYSNLGQPERANEYYQKAFQLREHASEREKLALTADYYLNVTGELDKAAQTYQEEIESYPRASVAYGNLGVVFALQGEYAKATDATRQLVRLSPDQVSSYVNLADYALALQRFDEARQIIHQQAPKLDDFAFHNALYALAFLGSDSSAMAEQQQWYAAKPEAESYGLSLASDTEAFAGRLEKARDLNKRAVEAAIHADSKETGAVFQANAALREAAYGNPAEARQLAAAALKLAPSSQDVESEAALAFAMAGDTAKAELLAQDLGKRFPLDTQRQSLWLPAIRAQVALNRKNPTAALTITQAGSPLELGQIVFINNLSCLYPVYVHAEAYLAAGQAGAAVAEFHKILDHGGLVWNCWTGSLAHLGLARAHGLQSSTSQGADGEAARAQSLAAYKDFLALWKDAEPEIPILKEARAEYSKLQ